MRRGPWNSLTAEAIEVAAAGFSGNLSSADTNVQLALATLDALSLSASSLTSGSASATITADGLDITDGATSVHLNISSGDLVLKNSNDGGDVYIKGEIATNVEKTIFKGAPDGAAELYHAGVLKLSTHADGIEMIDAGKIVWDAAPASDATGTGEELPSETVDQNTVGAGGLLRLGSDGNWDDADKDAAATCGRLAIALESGTGTKKLLTRGFFRLDSWNWTPGAQLYVGDSGAITNDVSGYTTGDIVQVVGYAKTADIVWFEPSPDYLEVA